MARNLPHHHNISLTFTLGEEGVPIYTLTYKQRTVIKPGRLGFDLVGDASLKSGFILVGTKDATFDETWKPVWGEVSSIRNHYNELLVQLEQKATGRELNICFRLFNDGLGFRYAFPAQPKLKYFVLKEEDTEFALTGDHDAFWLPGDFDTEEYRTVMSKLSDVREKMKKAVTPNVSQTTFSPTGVQTPLMLNSQDGLYINIHEAALINYSAMNLNLDDKTFVLTTFLTPDAEGNKGHLQAPCNSPWRTVIVSDKAADILMSKLILNLNEPTHYQDTLSFACSCVLALLSPIGHLAYPICQKFQGVIPATPF